MSFNDFTNNDRKPRPAFQLLEMPVRARSMAKPRPFLLPSAGSQASPKLGRMAVTLLYDGQCRLCQRSAQRVRRWDAGQRVRLLDLHAPEASLQFPQVKLEQALAKVHLVDGQGRVYRGIDAWSRVLRELPGRRWIAHVMEAPGVHALAAKAYQWVARNRYRWNRDCEGTCRLERS